MLYMYNLMCCIAATFIIVEAFNLRSWACWKKASFTFSEENGEKKETH